MKLLLFVHTDPRKTSRSATIRVQKGDYKIESNQKDSNIEIVFEDKEGSSCIIQNDMPISFLAPSNIHLNIFKIGSEPHLTIYLVGT